MRRKETACKRKISDCEEVIPVKLPGRECLFCLRSGVNELELGELITKDGITVHYFCLLLSSGLSQSGKLSNKKAIKGFLQQDILKELKRGDRLRCVFCHSKGATIGCNVATCRKSFHLPCGRQRGTLHLFFDTFRSFCEVHWPKESVSGSCLLLFSSHGKTECAICLSAVELVPSSNTLYSPCCTKTWYHRSCIQQHALSAGKYFFKCPLCNNLENFQKDMLHLGIYIPDQDASWERQLGAYSELLERHDTCDAPKCKCPQGRNHDEEKGWFDLILCQSCGSFGSHRRCRGLTRIGTSLLCPVCSDFATSAAKEATANHHPAYEGAGPSNVHGGCEGSVFQSQCYPLIVSSSDTFCSATCEEEEEDLEVDVENSSDVEGVRAPEKKRGRPRKKSIPLKSSEMVNDTSDSHFTVVTDANLQLTSIQKGNDTKFARGVWHPPLSPTIAIPKIDSLISIPRGKVKLNCLNRWKYNEKAGCLEKKRQYVKSGYYSGKTMPLNVNKGIGSTQKEKNHVSMRKAKHDTLSDEQKTVNQTSKSGGSSFTQLKLDEIWSKVLTVVTMHLKETDAQDIQKVTTDSNLDGAVTTQLNTTSKATDKNLPRLKEIPRREVRIKDMLPQLELEFNGETQSGQAAAAVVKRKPKGRREKMFRKSNWDDINCEKELGELLITTEKEMQDTEKMCRKKNQLTKSQSTRENGSPLDEFDLTQAVEFDGDVQNEDRISGSQILPAQYKLKGRNSVDFLESTTSPNFKAKSLNSVEMSGFSPPSDLKCSNRIGKPEGGLSLGFETPENYLSLGPTCEQKRWTSENNLSLGPTYTSRFVVTPKKDLHLGSTCSNRVEAPENNLSPGPTRSDRIETHENNLCPRPTCSNRTETPECNLSLGPMCSNGVETPETNLPLGPTCSNRVETPEINLPLRPMTSNRVETPENNLSPIPTCCDRLETPENNLSRGSTCSNRTETPESSLSLGPICTNGVETPQINLPLEPTCSGRVETPEINLPLGPMCSNRVETPESNLSPIPTCSDRLETSENNLSLGSTCSNRTETPESNLSLGPMCTNRVEIPQINLPLEPTCSDKVKTPENNLPLRPMCSNSIETPENNLSPIPTCSDRLETSENNLSLGSTCSNRTESTETPESNLSLGPMCTNGVEIPQINLPLEPTCSDRDETPEKNFPLGPMCSNSVETPENNLSPIPTCSDRLETSENNLSLGLTCSTTVETPEKNLPLEATCSNRLETPERNLPLGPTHSNRVDNLPLGFRPTCLNRLETPEKNLPLRPVCSNRVETHEENLFLGSTCSSRFETPQKNLPLGPTC